MSNPANDAADAVVTAINAATLTVDVEAKRSYESYELELKETGRVRVDVMPVPTEAKSAFETQDKLRYDLPVHVVIRRKLNSSEIDAKDPTVTRAAVDELVDLLFEIYEAIVEALTEDDTDPTMQAVELQALWVPDHLMQMHQYTGIIKLTFATRVAVTV